MINKVKKNILINLEDFFDIYITLRYIYIICISILLYLSEAVGLENYLIFIIAIFFILPIIISELLLWKIGISIKHSRKDFEKEMSNILNEFSTLDLLKMKKETNSNIKLKRIEENIKERLNKKLKIRKNAEIDEILIAFEKKNKKNIRIENE